MITTNIINAGILESSTEEVEARRIEIQALYEKRNFSPERVAAAIVRAIRRNRAVVPVAAEAWLAYYLKRWAPGLLARIDELRAAGRVVIGELPGQVGAASQMGCAYRLQQQGDEWVTVPLEQSMKKR